MRAVIQRVLEAGVTISGGYKRHIGPGLLILVGIEENDNGEDIEWLAGKICNLRIFDDAEGVMNCSVKETGGALLIVSQFTLHALTRKGNRPSYIRAAKPDIAIPLYNAFVSRIEAELDQEVQTGIFGAMMDVSLINSGPVTIIIDTKNKE